MCVYRFTGQRTKKSNLWPSPVAVVRFNDGWSDFPSHIYATGTSANGIGYSIVRMVRKCQRTSARSPQRQQPHPRAKTPTSSTASRRQHAAPNARRSQRPRAKDYKLNVRECAQRQWRARGDAVAAHTLAPSVPVPVLQQLVFHKCICAHSICIRARAR